MKRSEVKRSFVELLTTGTGKTEASTKLSGPGVTANQLALFIASYAYAVCGDGFGGRTAHT